jgi:hypothetical protein
MNREILKAHALVAQKKMKPADFDALILAAVAGNRRWCDKCNRLTAWERKNGKLICANKHQP